MTTAAAGTAAAAIIQKCDKNKQTGKDGRVTFLRSFPVFYCCFYFLKEACLRHLLF